jgi:hypothetical protein
LGRTCAIQRKETMQGKKEKERRDEENDSERKEEMEKA